MESVVRFHGTVPFGYADRFSVHPAEAALLRECVESLISTTTTPYDWAKEFNRRGFRTRRGGTFKGDGLAHLLRNAMYCGVVVRHGVQTGETAGWDALFDQHTWAALQARLSRPGIRARLHHEATAIGTSLARCGTCGAGMDSHLTPHMGRRYSCNSKRNPDRLRDGRRHPQCKAEDLEDRIRDGMYEVLTEHGTDLVHVERSIEAINREIGVLHAAKHSTLGLIRDPANGLTLADHAERIRGLEQQVAVAEAERDDVILQHALDRIDLNHFSESWEAVGLEAQRTLINRLLAVTVYTGVGPERVHVADMLS